MPDPSTRITILERKVRDLERKMEELTRLLKRAEDPTVQQAGRRAS